MVYGRASDLVPVLGPLIAEPGGVSAFGNQLVVRATAAEIDEIRRVLARLDRQPANLVISVRHAEAAASEGAHVGIVTAPRHRASRPGEIEVLPPPRGAVGVELGTHRSRTDETTVQTLRALEGREAFIAVSESTPEREVLVVRSGRGRTTVVEGVEHRETVTGFHVRARLVGEDGVLLEIAPRIERRRQDGTTIGRGAATTTTVRLGQWVEIGGSDEAGTSSGSGITAATGRTRDVRAAISLRVDRAR
ncbi:MAG: hypothetical protein H6983_25295 [Ectothiorhodospiraceae bacterium]|nr:hypothetical protein [Ectothiorhodospiraceae bacterium]